ncbi:MAG TPA: hypothetical protein VGS07_32505 [Thermoanaerobaculia bacterium]|nr:hypothetical protein [Thermoanaerobaculia bacterium]
MFNKARVINTSADWSNSLQSLRPGRRWQRRAPIYTDFEDQMGEESEVSLPGFVLPNRFERFTLLARQVWLEAVD